MTDEQIKKLALDFGFKENKLKDGTKDINKRLYDFARALMLISKYEEKTFEDKPVEERLYSLTITGFQAEIIQNACELYERLHAGQWWALEKVLPNGFNLQWDIEDRAKRHIEPLLDTSKFFFERNAGDIMAVIRHRLSWDRYPEGGYTVSFDRPIQFGKDPLPTIKRIE